MQRLGDSTWVISASDLSQLSACPWYVARDVDQRLGKGVVIPEVDDPMMTLVTQLGLEHEARELESMRRDFSTVVEIPYERATSPDDSDEWREEISLAREATLVAIHGGADVVFQAAFFQEVIPESPCRAGFQGFADFLVRAGDRWEVWDTKLARSARVTALIQLAAYVEQLQLLGIPVSPDIRLVLGDGTHSIHDATELIPLYLDQRRSLLELIHEREMDPNPTPWSDERYVACGTKGCPACSEQIGLHDDLFLIAGLRKTQRNKLRLAGFRTITDFASETREEVHSRVFGIGADTLSALHLQATLQVASRQTPTGRPAWEIISPSFLATLPNPDAGDLFFDFEGDPTYQEFDEDGRPLGGLSHGDETGWFGIEYLFGLYGHGLSAPGDSFLGLWAESFPEEEQRYLEFLSLVEERLNAYPHMHVYHYAAYERTRLGVLENRYRSHSPTVRRLLDGVLVDLYPIVTKSLAVGLPSYSLKALEALYFEPETRSGIAGGGESVVAFFNYLREKGAGRIAEAEQIKSSILHYNTLDCVSTQALRNWLLQIRESTPPS